MLKHHLLQMFFCFFRTAEALIDRKVVGRGFGYSDLEVKRIAAQNALDNLKKCCVYIEVGQ